MFPFAPHNGGLWVVPVLEDNDVAPQPHRSAHDSNPKGKGVVTGGHFFVPE